MVLAENLAAAVVLLGLMAYAVFGFADFGAGVWTLLARGPRATQQREAIHRAMGPVWETNHVWLIFVIVVLFTAFPPVFAYLFTALMVPLVIALISVVFRGAAFAFRSFSHGTQAGLPGTGTLFSIASIISPLAMGMAVGAVAGGYIAINKGVVTSGLFGPWLWPFAIVCGLMAVAMCGLLTAYFMTTRTTGQLQEDFRKRGLATCLALGVLMAIAIPVAAWDAGAFWDGLLEPVPLAAMGGTVVVWLAALAVLFQRRYPLAPPAAGGVVALLVGTWGVAQYPYLIPPSTRIADAAATGATLVPLLIALAASAAVLVPSLALLYLTFSEKTGGANS